MKNRRRTKAEREDDLVTMAEMIARDTPQKEIAAHFKLSKAQVQRDVAEIRRRWSLESAPDLKSIRAKLLLELKWLKNECRRGWEASQRPRETESQEKIRSEDQLDAEGAVVAGKDRVKASLRREGQCGNAAYLHEYLLCLDREAKIHGADAPQKMEVSTPKPIRLIRVLSATRSLDERTGEIIEEPAACGGKPPEVAPPEKTRSLDERTGEIIETPATKEAEAAPPSAVEDRPQPVEAAVSPSPDVSHPHPAPDAASPAEKKPHRPITIRLIPPEPRANE